jgi:hypothetical protein
MLELLEEEEILNMRQARDEMRERREEAERQVKEEEEREARRWEEKERRMSQEKERKDQESVVANKVAAVAYAHDFLKTLPQSVTASLASVGFFADPRLSALSSSFIPWLMERVEAKRQRRETARRIVSSVLVSSLEKAKGRHISLCDAIREGKRIEEEALERAKEQVQKKEDIKTMGKVEEGERKVMAREERERKIEEEKEQKERERQERLAEKARLAEEAAAKAALEAAEGEGEGEGEPAAEEQGEEADA